MRLYDAAYHSQGQTTFVTRVSRAEFFSLPRPDVIYTRHRGPGGRGLLLALHADHQLSRRWVAQLAMANLGR